MVKTITEFFGKYIKPASEGTEKISEHSLRVATAALLIEMMRADRDITEEERMAITGTIRSRFGLSAKETAELIRLAEEEIREAAGYYKFTSLINKGFSYEEKKRVVEHLWEVAFADKALDKHEEHMVRKIADLIYVSHKDFIEAKLSVRKRTCGK
jgi:uncharacterized tellurite resistance protein B-like protein